MCSGPGFIYSRYLFLRMQHIQKSSIKNIFMEFFNPANAICEKSDDGELYQETHDTNTHNKGDSGAPFRCASKVKLIVPGTVTVKF
jgi:hypothetical protein